MSEEHTINVSQQSGSYTALSEAKLEDPISFSSVFKKISGIALPMGMSFTFSFEVFLAVLFLQHLSESDDDKAASALVSTLMNTVCGLAVSPLFAVAIRLSHKLGEWRAEDKQSQLTSEGDVEASDFSIETATYTPVVAEEKNQPLLPFRKEREKRKEKIESMNVNSLIISAVIAVPASLTLYYSKPLLTSIFYQTDTVATSAEKFLRPYAFAVPGFMARISFEQILFSFGKAEPAMWMALASFGIGTSFSVYLGFGAPQMGQRGIAIGFLIEAYLTAALYYYFIKRNKECREFDFHKLSLARIRNNFDELKELLKLGGSFSFTFTIEFALTLAISIFSGWLGTESQAAMAYNMQFIYFQFIMLAAFSFSCAQEISRELGAKKNKNALAIANYGLLTTLIYLTPIPLILAIYPKALEVIAGGASEDVDNTLQTLVPIMCAGVVLDTFRYNLLQQLRALNDLSIPNAIAFVGMSAGIGLAAALGLKTPMGVKGVAVGYTAGLGVTAGALFWRRGGKVKELAENDESNAELSRQTCCEMITKPLSSCFSSFFSQRRDSSAANVSDHKHYSVENTRQLGRKS